MFQWILFLIIAIFLLWLYFKFFKTPKINSIVMFTGGVKAGKSACSLYYCIRDYKSRVRKVKLKNFFRRIFRKPVFRLPELYSNIPLAIPFVPLTKEVLTRQNRIVYGSVCFIDECSLVADSMSGISHNQSDKLRNEQVLLFMKLFGHMSHGGACYLNTQQICDVSFGIRRNISEYFYVHHMWKPLILPFCIAYVKECRYSEDGSITNYEEQDTEDYLKMIVIPKKVFKLYDCFCFDTFTNNKPVLNGQSLPDTLSADDIVSFNEYNSILMEKKNEKI